MPLFDEKFTVYCYLVIFLMKNDDFNGFLVYKKLYI